LNSPSPELDKITASNTLNDTEKKKLNELFKRFLDASPCNRKMYNKFIDKGFKFNFKINPNQELPGAFYHISMNIVIKNIDEIKYEVLWEELFHAYQHAY
jgi:hypothetical protein